MPATTNPTRYPEVMEFMNQALDSPRGIRLACKSKGSAFQLKQKVYAKKKDIREQYIRMYEDTPEHPERFRTPYEALYPELVEHDGQWYLYIHRETPLEIIEAHIKKVELL